METNSRSTSVVQRQSGGYKISVTNSELLDLNLEIASHRTSFHISALSQTSLVILLALVLSTPFVQMTGELGSPYKIYRIFFYALIAAMQAILLYIRGYNQAIKIFLNPSILVLIWFSISITWAYQPELAAKRTLLVWAIYIVIIGAACDLGYRRFIDILRVILTCALIINYITVLIFPDIGTHVSAPHQWRGALANKNIAGIVSAATILIFSFDAKKINFPVRILVIFTSAIFLIFTWSRTSLIATAIALTAGIVISRLRINERHLKTIPTAMLIIFFISIVATAALTIQRDFLLFLTEDSSALSLRNAIWRPMLLSYLDNPLLGSGYGSYWNTEANTFNLDAFGTQKWMRNVYQAHNGYLDIIVQTGIIGFFLTLYAAIIWPASQFPKIMSSRKEAAALIYSTITLLLIENLTETSIFSVDVFGSAILFSCISLIHRFNLRERVG